jgi:xanthosine utilization system XapX-like protein
MQRKTWLLVGAVIFALIVLVVRYEPHPPNFALVGAFALWAGAYLGRRVAPLMILGVMLLGDALFGFYAWQIMAVVYACTLLYVLIGRRVAPSLGSRNWLRRIGAPFAGVCVGSSIFFVLTNGAVWMFGNMYPKSAAGFAESLIAGLPFWRNGFLADMIGTAGFFIASAILAAILRIRVSRAERALA